MLLPTPRETPVWPKHCPLPAWAVVKGMGSWDIREQIWTLTLMGSVISGKGLSLCEPQFLQLHNGENNRTEVIGL